MQIVGMAISPTFNMARAFSNLFTIGIAMDTCPSLACNPQAKNGSSFDLKPFTAVQCCRIVERNGEFRL